eukprot:tig00021432_g21210.t1
MADEPQERDLSAHDLSAEYAGESRRRWAQFVKQYKIKAKEFVVDARPSVESLASASSSLLLLKGSQLEFFENRLKSAELFPIAEALRISNLSVQAIDLSYQHLDDAAAAAFARILNGNKTLQSLSLQGNRIGMKGLQAIANALLSNTVLGRIDLSENPLGDKAGEVIGAVIRGNQTLRELRVGSCELGTNALLAIALALRDSKTLRVLSVENPRLFSLQEETTVHLARALLPGCSQLQTLHLGKNAVRDYGCEQICDVLARNVHLTSLDLRCNKVTMEGAKAVARLLVASRTLCSLSLDHNFVRNEGAFAIAAALRSNNTLESLNLASNGIGDEGLAELAGALGSNLALRELFLWGNEFGQGAGRAFLELLASPATSIRRTDFRPYAQDALFLIAQVAP